MIQYNQTEEYEVSHIMISDKRKERNFDPQERIQEIYKLLEQGESFESLAKQYSDDRGSGNKGGELKPFTRGDLKAPEFEAAAYKLITPGRKHFVFLNFYYSGTPINY